MVANIKVSEHRIDVLRSRGKKWKSDKILSIYDNIEEFTVRRQSYTQFCDADNKAKVMHDFKINIREFIAHLLKEWHN